MRASELLGAMKDEMRFLVFLAVIAVVGFIFFKPIKAHFADLFPDKATEEERQFVGTVTERNPRIEEIQRVLKDLGFYRGVVDGKMGKETRSALMLFQKKNNIDATGKADSKTLNELQKQTYRSKNSSPPLRKKQDSSGQKVSYDIKTIQSLLKDAGFYKSEIDGKMGPLTVKAIKRFQKSRNLKESGVMNVKTWEELKKYEPGR